MAAKWCAKRQSFLASDPRTRARAAIGSAPKIVRSHATSSGGTTATAIFMNRKLVPQMTPSRPSKDQETNQGIDDAFASAKRARCPTANRHNNPPLH